MDNIKDSISTSTEFDIIYNMIATTQNESYLQLNRNLINLYWNIGQFVSKQVKQAGWGKNTVEELSLYISSKHS